MTTVTRPLEIDAPRPSGLPESFRWTTQATGLTLWCEPIGELANHGWTTTALPMRPGSDHPEAWARIAEAAGVERGRVVRLKQVHGSTVVRAAVDGTSGRPSEGDAVVAADPSVALAVQVADCVPLLILDPHSGAAAAVHAGWRGMAAGVIGAAVRRLAGDFTSEPDSLLAALGPSIGPCCYRVGAELRDAFAGAGWTAAQSDLWFRTNGELRFDLWRASLDQLVLTGLEPERIHTSALCTACHPEWFASYRRDGKGAGRQVGFIRPAAVTSVGA